MRLNINKNIFILKFLLPTIEFKCKKCDKEFSLKKSYNWEKMNFIKCSFSSIDTKMLNSFNKPFTTREIANAYFKREDNFLYMLISFLLVCFFIFIIYAFKMPNSIHIFTILSLCMFFYTYYKFVCFLNVDKVFKLLFPLCNEENEMIFETLITLAEINKISDYEYLDYINERIDIVKCM